MNLKFNFNLKNCLKILNVIKVHIYLKILNFYKLRIFCNLASLACSAQREDPQVPIDPATRQVARLMSLRGGRKR